MFSKPVKVDDVVEEVVGPLHLVPEEEVSLTELKLLQLKWNMLTSCNLSNWNVQLFKGEKEDKSQQSFFFFIFLLDKK